MAIEEITDIFTDRKDREYKRIVRPQQRVLIYNDKKEIIFDSKNDCLEMVFTPKTNTVKYGTKEEIDNHIEDIKDIEDIKIK